MFASVHSLWMTPGVLISYGVLLGKLNPFQVLVMTLIESCWLVGNAYLGYKVLGVLGM